MKQSIIRSELSQMAYELRATIRYNYQMRYSIGLGRMRLRANIQLLRILKTALWNSNPSVKL